MPVVNNDDVVPNHFPKSMEELNQLSAMSGKFDVILVTLTRGSKTRGGGNLDCSVDSARFLAFTG